jgi:LPXTG-motif cell wall-anchored protein
LKKLVLLGAIVAMVIVAAAPAVAQVAQGESEKSITSGKSAPSFSVSNKGNNVSLCPTGQQVGQTGQVANEQGVTQYNDKTEDISFGGSDITVTPSTSSQCTQEIKQAAAAKAAPKAEAKAEAKAAPKAEAKAELPKTGGVAGTASLLGLGAGALLVAGGLLARRMFR